MEWAGAFGDLGTLIPFVVAYIAMLGVNPSGIGIHSASGYFARTALLINMVGTVAMSVPLQPKLAGGGGTGLRALRPVKLLVISTSVATPTA